MLHLVFFHGGLESTLAFIFPLLLVLLSSTDASLCLLELVWLLHLILFTNIFAIS